jgi:XTP/dITP diphosphohydrolase
VTPDATPILLATTNPAKQQALRELLAGLPLRPVTPGELGLHSAPEEVGETHEAIARLKAREWSLAASMLAIATDGGLVVPALGARWESRYTHRFAGPAADDGERLRRLLELMRPYHGDQRAASWVEALAVADKGEVLASWELAGGAGVIAESAEGGTYVPGFWAFTVWHFPHLSKSYNQLTSAERDALGDHWSRLRGLVQEFFGGYLVGSVG